MNALRRLPWMAVPRFAPLLGVLIGAASGCVYWLGMQIWPASIAVVLSMVAAEILSAPAPESNGRTAALGMSVFVFGVLVKYNALMALSAASLPFALPANLALGLIMIAGQCISRALAVSVSMGASYGDLGIALAIGIAPAALIGIPGLVGLVLAISAHLAYVALARRRGTAVDAVQLNRIRQLTEVCFYLGVLAARAFI